MKVAVCSIGRLENRYIKEFVEYYKKLGVDKIFLYDNNYDGEEYFETVIGDYVGKGFVEVIDFRNKDYCQLEAYQDCYNKHKDEYDWICYFDIDEYLTFENERVSIKKFLSRKCFRDYDMIHVNWKVYGDNNLIHYEDKPLRERFTEPIMPLDFKYGYDFPENNHIKSIVRGGLEGVTWNATPHTPNGIARCCNAVGNECKSASPFNEFDFSTAWLNHYQTKTIEEWITNKVRRGFADGNRDRFKKNNPIKEFFGRNQANEEKIKYVESILGRNSMIIVSMTTIPNRLERLKENLPSLLNQSYKFDKLVINIDDNLSKEDYEQYESLKELDERIEINLSEAKWRSCNKLLPTLIRYPNDVVITVDDDIYYPVDSIKLLVEKWNENTDCIITHEINPIFIENGYIGYKNAFDVMLEQKEWGKYFSNCCLFPPHCFDGSDLFDYDKMMECTKGLHDELWFWVNSTINGVQCIGLNYIYSFSAEILRPYTDDEYQLTNYNKENTNIADYMDKINERYGKRLIGNVLRKPVMFKLNKDNVNLFIVLFEQIRNTYNYVFNVDVNGLTSAWRDKVKYTIKESEKR